MHSSSSSLEGIAVTVVMLVVLSCRVKSGAANDATVELRLRDLVAFKDWRRLFDRCLPGELLLLVSESVDGGEWPLSSPSPSSSSLSPNICCISRMYGISTLSHNTQTSSSPSPKSELVVSDSMAELVEEEGELDDT